MTVKHIVLSVSELVPSEAELAARLHMPRGEQSPEAEGALSRLTAAASPACMLAFGKLDEAMREQLQTAGGDLENSFYIALFAVTLGHGVDRELARAARLGAAPAFLFDAVASAMAEAAANAAEAHLRALTPKLSWSRRRSPGYGRLPLSLQPTLLRMTAADKRLGIALTASGMMLPTKSITAILGGNDETRSFH